MAAGPTRSSTNWDTGVAHVDYASDSTPGFIPEVWSGKLRENFYKATVFGEIANTDHEGEIRSFGDNVIIRTIPTITIGDYSLGQQLSYTQPTSDQVELAIDKAKYFAFQVDDVDAMQSDLNLMDAWSKAAGEQMKVEVDRVVLGAVYADAAAANAGATAGALSGDINLGAAKTTTDGDNAIAIDATTILGHILDHGLVLDEQNCPEEGRFIVLPAWAVQKLKQSDIKDASLSGDGTSILRNGRVGMIDRFTVYSSNNVATSETGVVYEIIAGHKKGITFASQMTNMEHLPNPNSFGQLVRGLQVFGFKVIDPTLVTNGKIKK